MSTSTSSDDLPLAQRVDRDRVNPPDAAKEKRRREKEVLRLAKDEGTGESSPKVVKSETQKPEFKPEPRYPTEDPGEEPPEGCVPEYQKEADSRHKATDKKSAAGKKPADVKKPATKPAAKKPAGTNAEKLKYDKPGQTQPTPLPSEPLAKFYLSLLKQRPDSEIANKWCVQRGLVSAEHAERWLKKNGKASTAAPKSPAKPRTSAAAKRKPSTGKPAEDKRKAERPTKQVKKKALEKSRKFDSSASESEDEASDDSEDEKMPVSNRARKSSSRGAKAAPKPKNGKHSVKKKRKRDDSDDDDSDDEPPTRKGKPAKGNGSTPAKPQEDAEMSEEDSDDIPLAQKPAKVKARV